MKYVLILFAFTVNEPSDPFRETPFDFYIHEELLSQGECHAKGVDEVKLYTTADQIIMYQCSVYAPEKPE